MPDEFSRHLRYVRGGRVIPLARLVVETVHIDIVRVLEAEQFDLLIHQANEAVGRSRDVLGHRGAGVVGRVDDDRAHHLLEGEDLVLGEIGLRAADLTRPGGDADRVLELQAALLDLAHDHELEGHLGDARRGAALVRVLLVEHLAAFRFDEKGAGARNRRDLERPPGEDHTRRVAEERRRTVRLLRFGPLVSAIGGEPEQDEGAEDRGQQRGDPEGGLPEGAARAGEVAARGSGAGGTQGAIPPVRTAAGRGPGHATPRALRPPPPAVLSASA